MLGQTKYRLESDVRASAAGGRVHGLARPLSPLRFMHRDLALIAFRTSYTHCMRVFPHVSRGGTSCSARSITANSCRSLASVSPFTALHAMRLVPREQALNVASIDIQVDGEIAFRSC